MVVREAEEKEEVPVASRQGSVTPLDPRTRFPTATVDVTKHAIEQARLRWPVRFRQQSAAQIAETLLHIYQQATQVERRKDGKWRYFHDQMWVVATLGYDQHTVVLVTCYPPRVRLTPREGSTLPYAQVSARPPQPPHLDL